MSNSQEQSLDENTVFLPVHESSPQFLYCETERQAVERLLDAGPEAFYSSVGTGRSGCFLSSEEVSQISSWAQDYRFSRLQAQRETHGEISGSGTDDLRSTYFPSSSDTPTPNLELGWPERGPWTPKESIMVHTSPPAEGEPAVREIIRWHLQKASKVIAIVTDGLTDCTVIGDLHNAASRGVAVYIILNQRSIQENFTLNRLRHPNMRVRVLGGKTFCSRTGRMVVGEMKDKFLLVDIETVIHGSYSLTWTDAHLHRQLITVLRGAVIDSFDREFRILFAASLPVPDDWRTAGTPAEGTHQLKDLSNLRFQKHLPLEPEITSPPSPPADSLLDWEAMGVVQRDICFPDSPLDRHEPKEAPLQNNLLLDKHTAVVDGFDYTGNQFVDTNRVLEIISPVTSRKTAFHNMQPLLTNITPERRRSPERIKNPVRVEREEDSTERALFRRLSVEKSTNLDGRPAQIYNDKATEAKHDVALLSPTLRRDRSRTYILEEEHSINKASPGLENAPSSRRPLILRVPQSESFSCLSDLMKRIQPQLSTSGPLKKGSKAAVSEFSQSVVDLSTHSTDTNNVPVPRFKASCFDQDHITPALALMKTRNDDLKPLLYRTPKSFTPRERPRSYSYALDWRMSLAETDEHHEMGARK